MKRFTNKFIYALLILPLILLLSGCDLSSKLNIGAVSDDIKLASDEKLGEDADKVADVPSNADAPAKNAKDLDNDSQGPTIALSGKSATLDIDSEGRSTPFVPYRERNLTYSSVNFGDLPLPPMSGEMDELLNSLISAKVTGILYDPKSPSAIINVLDSDYLVKPGDKVESFQIAGITKDYVAIKTGSNVYRAKVGDIVDGEIYGSGVYNLGHRFAGTHRPARKEDVMVFATKKNSETKKEPAGFNDLSLPPVPEININNNNNKGNNTGTSTTTATGNNANTTGSNIPVPKINLKTQAGEIPLPLGSSGNK